MDAKRAVVTGAGTGIGRATSALLLAQGFEVVTIGRTAAPLEQLVRDMGDLGRRLMPLSLDVRDGSALGDALSNVGPVDALVANAGVCKQSRIDDPDADAIWRELISINLDGVWQTFRAALPYLKPDGRAVVVSSGLGKLGRAGYGAYTASKHGVIGLVKCLAKELAPKRITVNAVCPGWVDTEMAKRDLVRTAEEEGTTFDQAKKAALEGIPLGRFVEADEVAKLICWLVSENAAAITGEAYNISCGEFFA
ncbi:MAG: SDR family oxidoreductase [Proteobacteria bacterium]|nr:SDR family oxidoreductase [Pseudomonadota bacterium]